VAEKHAKDGAGYKRDACEDFGAEDAQQERVE